LHSHYSEKDKPNIINENSKIIYIVRDFRDVLVSSFFHHYRIDSKLVLKQSKSIDLYTLIMRILWRSIIFNIEILKMSRYWASISGGKSFIAFLKGIVSLRWIKDMRGGVVGRWDEHVMYWKNFSSNVAFIRYEDMLVDPNETLNYALKKIKIHFDMNDLNKSINNQSFDKKKTEYLAQGLSEKADFLRKGIQGDYINYLNQSTLKTINNRYGHVMKILKYK